jgi:hypothetical protein
MLGSPSTRRWTVLWRWRAPQRADGPSSSSNAEVVPAPITAGSFANQPPMSGNRATTGGARMTARTHARAAAPHPRPLIARVSAGQTRGRQASGRS